MTPQQEADYYKNQAKTARALGKRDKDYLIVAERFDNQAKRWQEKADKDARCKK